MVEVAQLQALIGLVITSHCSSKAPCEQGPEMPTTILVRECYFLSFDAAVFGDRENSQNPSELNLHNKHRDSIHQFGMP